MQDVVIYTKSWCGYCTRAKELLDRKGVPFKEVEISNDDALRDEMVDRAGGRQTVPQIFIGRRTWAVVTIFTDSRKRAGWTISSAKIQSTTAEGHLPSGS